MIAYLDTSVILSCLLNQPGVPREWGVWDAAYTSALTRTEVFRTIGRLRLESAISDDDRVTLQMEFEEVWDRLYKVQLDQAILDAAAGPMPTVIRTLDAIHLVTALRVWADLDIQEFKLLTNDNQLTRAAMAMGLKVG